MPAANYRRLRCTALAVCLSVAGPAHTDDICPEAAVIDHVSEQFRVYGPQSLKREFFGFVYRDGEAVRSSVVRGSYCDSALTCSVDPRKAADGIPRGAKILGEWHTHPGGDASNILSADDVRGAWNNRKIRCYTAYYAAADGNFYSWSPATTSVPTAMNSRVLLGNYRRPASGRDGLTTTGRLTDGLRPTRGSGM